MIVAVALGLALGIQAFVVKPYRIPSGSMEPTLSVGQRVLVNRIGMELRRPARRRDRRVPPARRTPSSRSAGPRPHVVRPGGAACSEPEPEKSSVNFIKRIVAGPGDVISIVEGHVIRNGAAREGLLHPDRAARSAGVQLPDADQDSAPVTGS